MLLCQFLVLAGNRFWFYLLCTYVLRVQCGVVLVFWFWREIVFGVAYVLSVQYSCAVVSVFMRSKLSARSFLKNIENFLIKKRPDNCTFLMVGLLLVFYRTTSLQSLLFLKNIEILCTIISQKY